jgi:outer membrane receptor protein involved in Fe transport
MRLRSLDPGAIRLALLAPSALALIAANPAFARAAQPGPQATPPAEEEAQPAKDAADSDATGNDIIVTATKRATSLQNTPIAVTVTSADTIQKAHIQDIEDLATVVPSLRVSPHQSSAQTDFIIRGFGNGANNSGVEPSVGVFIDGVYRSRSAAQIADFPDIERVEVLRGPQSTLFGKNASAGVVSIVTKEPQFHLGADAELSYGNYNAVIAKGRITGPLSNDIAVSLAGGYDRRDGFTYDPTTGNHIDNRDRWFVRGQMLYEPNTQLKVRLIADYGRMTELCCSVVNVRASSATTAIQALGGQVNPAANPFGNVAYNNFDSTNDIRNYGVSGQVDYELGPLTLTSITAWRKSRNITNQDSDFTSADILGQNSADVRIRTFTQEFRATAGFGPLSLLAGAYYFNEKIDQDGAILFGKDFRNYANLLIQGATGGTLNVAGLESTLGQLSGNPSLYTGKFFSAGQGIIENYALKNSAFSLFGEANFKVTPRLKATLGIDYTHDTKHYAINDTHTDVFSAVNIPALINNAIAAYPAALQPAVAAQLVPLLALRPLQFLVPFPNVPNAVEPGRTSDGDVSWTARLAYDLAHKVNVYVSYATGFKASSINLSRDSRPALADAPALVNAGLAGAPTTNVAGLTIYNPAYGSRLAGPEKSKVIEVGFKADWGVAQLNVAAFHQIINGFQSNIFNGTGFILANAGQESVNGFEIEGAVHPTEEITLSEALTYLKPKYDSYVQSPFGDASGLTPAGIPPISVTLGAEWNHALANGDHIVLRGDWHYESPTQIEDGMPGFIVKDPLTQQVINYQPGIDIARQYKRTVSEIDASLTYHLHNGLELGLWGRNLTDNRYFTVIFDSPLQTGSISGYQNEPRTYGVSARYAF